MIDDLMTKSSSEMADLKSFLEEIEKQIRKRL